jgi:heavy metal translocating P-type ATPase
MASPRPPYIFDEFFASGRAETISPFLTPDSRNWGKNLSLRSATLSACLLALAFGASFFHSPLANFLLLLVYFLVGTPALLGSLEDIKNLNINIDVLMTLAALLSVLIGSGMEGALLLVLFEFSAAMEEAVAHKTKSALLTLGHLSPKTACVVGKEGVLFDRSVREIDVGSSILVKAGEVIPLDGAVISGSSFVNLVHLTGEGQPVPKTIGDEVQAGARNLDGTLTLRVTRSSADSTISRIIKLITQAQESKPRVQRLLDTFGKWYALTIILLSCAFALFLPFLTHLPYLGPEGAIYRALAFLIAASPCALIIATPTAYLSAISSCARKGIILKGGIVLDALANCSTIAFDKTGTLTTGALVCDSIAPLRATLSPDVALQVAASLERHAVHPIAEAICRLAEEREIPPLPLDSFRAVPGFGLEATLSLDGRSTAATIGHAAFISSKLPAQLQEPLQEAGQLSAFLLVGTSLFAFHFTDALRPGARETIERLRSRFRLVMLTGDRQENADYIARALRLDEVYAALRPEDKLTKVSALAEEGGLAMVGDGINDAPALARSTVGISMGKIGSATAVDASDVVFLNDDLPLLDWLTRKARAALSIVRQNLTLALGVILLATTPALLGLLPLWLAVILHEGGTVLVGFNSLRLLRR